MAPQREWFRTNHFFDHPRFKDKDPVSWASPDGKRPKVACRLCWPAAIQKHLINDQKEVAGGKLVAARSAEMIKEQSEHQIYITAWHLPVLAVWALPIGDNTREWIQARSETLLRHLINTGNCIQPQAVRQAAMRECEQHNINFSISSPKAKQSALMMNLALA